MLFVTFVGALAGSMLVASFLQKKLKLHSETVRKWVHVSVGLIFFAATISLPLKEILGLAGLSILAVVTSHQIPVFKDLHIIDRKSYGDVLLPLGIGVTAFFFMEWSLEAFQFGILVATLSDSFAALVGKTYGKHPFRILGATKSIEGSAAFFIVTLIIGTFFLPPSPALIGVALALTFLEAISNYGSDNITLPFSATYLALFLL